MKKFNPKGFGNIILIRKRRTIIFLWKAYKLLLWMVYNTMPEKMFSYLNIHRMKWFDLHESLLNSHISYLYWAVKLTPSTLSVSRFYFEAEGALVEFWNELVLVLYVWILNLMFRFVIWLILGSNGSCIP